MTGSRLGLPTEKAGTWPSSSAFRCRYEYSCSWPDTEQRARQLEHVPYVAGSAGRGDSHNGGLQPQFIPEVLVQVRLPSSRRPIIYSQFTRTERERTHAQKITAALKRRRRRRARSLYGSRSGIRQ